MNTMDTAHQCAASREAGPGSKRVVLASPNADRILSDQLVGGGKNVLQQIGSKTCHRSPCVWPNSSRAWRSTAIGPGEGTLVRYAASGRVIDRGVHHPLFVSAGHAGRDQFFSASGQPNSQRATSACGTFQTCRDSLTMSAHGGKADIPLQRHDFRF
jgi:hypothetical protein